jgi:hypothetical protein
MRCQNCSSNKDMRTNLISRHFRILRVFFTFGAIGFVQFLSLSAAAPGIKDGPVNLD